jgi:hypothetical protein
LSLTKLWTNSTNKHLSKFQTGTSLKLEPKFESETETISNLKYKFLQNFFFLQNKNMTGYLDQYVEHPKWKILKIQILSSCEHFVEHWQKQNQMKSKLLVLHCSSSLHACSHALGGCSVDASPLCPDPSPGRRRRRGGSTPGPPSLLPSNLHVADRPALASADPQHSAAETNPCQHASKADEASVARARRQHVLRRSFTGRPRPRRSGL